MLLNRIELFVTVVQQHNSLAKAARVMHVSPSSVSQRLKSLENEFGVKLYKRTREGIEPTAEGRILLSTGQEVLNSLAALRKTLNPSAEKSHKRLVVAATSTPSAKYMPLAIARFQKICPDIKVTFLTSLRRTVEQWVQDGEVDIAIIQGLSEPRVTDLANEYFAVDSVACFVHVDHPFARKQKVSIRDLEDTALIVREGMGTTNKILALLRSHGMEVDVALRCASPDAVKAAVRQKMGVGILFQNQIREDVESKQLKIVRVAGFPRITKTNYVVYHKTKPLKISAAKFLDLLRTMKIGRRNASKPL